MKIKVLASIAALLLFNSSQAHALTYFLDQNNSRLQGGPWASVTLTDTTYYDLTQNKSYDAVKFTVDPLEGAFFSVTDKFGLQNFAFNENTGLANLSDVVKYSDPQGWDVDYTPSGSSGPYGKFELTNDATGQYRANPLEFYLYSLTAFDITAEQFAVPGDETTYIFAAHITGFNAPGMLDDKGNDLTSAQFATSGTPVPEPGTFALLGAGLLGLILYKKRSSN